MKETIKNLFWGNCWALLQKIWKEMCQNIFRKSGIMVMQFENFILLVTIPVSGNLKTLYACSTAWKTIWFYGYFLFINNFFLKFWEKKLKEYSSEYLRSFTVNRECWDWSEWSRKIREGKHKTSIKQNKWSHYLIEQNTVR